MRTEGEMLAVQSALAVLSNQVPVIIINELEILLPGGLSNANPKVTPRLQQRVQSQCAERASMMMKRYALNLLLLLNATLALVLAWMWFAPDGSFATPV